MHYQDFDYDGFGDFGEDQDSFCHREYGADDGLLKKCLKRPSGIMERIKNPGLNAPPWTDVGRNARGLPARGIIGKALSVVSKKGGGGGSGGGADGGGGGAAATPQLTDAEHDLLAPKKALGIGAIAAIAGGAALLFLKGRR